MDPRNEEELEWTMLYRPLQTLLLRALDDPCEDDWLLWYQDLEEEQAGNNSLWMRAHDFERHLMVVDFMQEKEPERWPHLLVLAQYLAL